MRHEDLSLLEDSVRIANPIPQPDELVGSEAAARVLLMARRQMTGTAPQPQIRPQPGRRGWLRPALVFATAVVVILASIGILALMGGEPAEVVEEPDLVTTTLPPDDTQDAITYQVRPLTEAEQQPSLAPSLNDVSDLAFAPDGSLWAATHGGVVRWDIASGTPTIFTEADGLLGSPESIDVAPDGTVWVASSDWVARYDGTWTSFTGFDGIEYVRIPSGAAVALPDGEAWFWADMTPDAGLLHFDGSTWSAIAAPDDWLDLPGGMAFSLDAALDGTLWVGSNYGALAFDGTSWTRYTPRNSGISALHAPWVAAAPDGTVWVGTKSYENPLDPIPKAEVSRFDGSTWTADTTAEGIAADEAKVAVGLDGTVWVLAGEGISRFDGDIWTNYTGLGHDYGSAVDPDGALWQPSSRGITSFDGNERTSLVMSSEAAPSGVPDLTLVPAATPVTTPTPIGDITWHHFTAPPGHGLADIVSTPFGLVALDGNVLRWSQDLVHWSGTALPLEPWRLTSDEDQVIAYGAAVLWLGWNQDALVPNEVLDLGGRMSQVVAGDRGTVVVSGLDMYHAPQGRNFVQIEDSPQPPQLAQEWTDWEDLTGCFSNSIAISATMDLGPVLATDSGFAALTPAHPANWNNRPLCEPVVWASGDGGSWELLSAETPFGSRAVVTGVASHNDRHIAVGADYGVDAIWLSDDAITWTQVERPDGLTDPTAVAGSDRGWLLLEDQGTGWVSPNGITWTRVPDGMPGTRTFWAPQTVSVGSGMIAISGTEEIVFGVFEE